MHLLHLVKKDESGPSVPEMKEMLNRGDCVDTYPHVEHKSKACVKCGNEKPDFWIILYHERFCNICGAS